MRARSIGRFSVLGICTASALLATHGQETRAAEAAVRSEAELRALIVAQTERLEALKQKMAEEDAKLAELRRTLGLDAPRNPDNAAPVQPMMAGNDPKMQAAEPIVVGQAPADENKAPQIAPIFDQPGVLTPRGKLVLEPSLQYGYASSNRVSLVGYTIIPALTIGLIDVREVKRNTWTGALTARWGLTNRFEIEAKLPYVYRYDSVLSRPQNLGSDRDQLFSSSGHGIGDFEMTGRYQINQGGSDRPYYVGTLRFKSRTGKDPFEVTTDLGANPNTLTGGLQSELPTGSGFYTLQPGLTVLYPSDPAVFFGGLNYQYNFKRSNVSMHTTDGNQFIGDVQPGGVLGFNFGMGLALNERSSFSLGYDHASVGKMKLNGGDAPNSVRTELGTLLLGYSHRLNTNTWLNLTLGAGVTRDAPDLTLTLRLPTTF